MNGRACMRCGRKDIELHDSILCDGCEHEVWDEQAEQDALAAEADYIAEQEGIGRYEADMAEYDGPGISLYSWALIAVTLPVLVVQALVEVVTR